MSRIIKIIFLLIICVFGALSGASVHAQEETLTWNDSLNNHGTVMLLVHARTGEIIRANQAAAEFYGYSINQLQGMNIDEINALSAEEVEQERLRASQRESNYFLFPHRLSNGDIRTVEVYSYPADREGEVLFSIIHDITARQAAEQALADNNERLVLAESIANLGHWEFNLNDDQAFFSEGAARVLGLSADEVTLGYVQELIHPDDLPMRDSALQALIEEDQPYDVSFRVIRPSDGEVIYIRSIAEYDADRDVIFGTLLDITEYQAMVTSVRHRGNIVIGVVGLALVACVIGVLVLLRLLRLRKESEARLKESIAAATESDRQLRSVLDNMPGMAYRCSNDGNWTMHFVSGGAAELLGFDPEDLINNDKVAYNDLILPEYREYLWVAWQSALSQNVPLTVEYQVRTAMGDVKWVWEQGCGVFDENGELLFIEGLILDVSPQKRAEEALRRREQDLAVTLDSIGDGVIATDIRGKVTRINPIAERLTGWSKDEAVGRPLTEVFNIISSITRQPASNPVFSVIKSGKIVGLANHTSLIAKDGTEHNIADSAAPIMDGNSNMLGVILVFRDVTEVYNQQEALAESEEKFRSLFEYSLNAIAVHELVVDNQGDPVDYIFLEANAAFERHTGLKRKDIIGKRVTEVLPRIQEGDLIERYGKVVLDNKPAVFTYYMNSTRQYLDISAYPVGNGQFATVFQDITEQKQSEEALRKSEQLLRETQHITKVGGWGWDVNEQEMTWTEELFYIHGLSPWKDASESCSIATIAECIDEKERSKFMSSLNNCIDYGEGFDMDVRFHSFDGKRRWVRIAGYAVKDKQGKVERVIGNMLDITEAKLADEKLKYIYFHDSVTGLYNRSFFEEELKRLDTERQLPMSMILADVDGLKIINDSFGHSKGDELLRIVGEILTTVCRKEDIVARYGGDEFAILLPQTSASEVHQICARIESACNEHRNKEFAISLALGYATKEAPKQDASQVLRTAEDYMYQQKMSKQSSNRSALVASLQKALGEKSHETREHARRLQDLAVRLGSKLKLSDAQLNEISVLALLHDIGKVAIPETIINKPGPLTDAERETIEKHPEIGYRIAAAAPDLAFVARGIHAHHERWDGAGYPSGLQGEEIPLSARVVAIADAFEAMTSDRPYRKALSVQTALGEIRACKGTQFDPHIAEKFVDMFEQEES